MPSGAACAPDETPTGVRRLKAGSSNTLEPPFGGGLGEGRPGPKGWEFARLCRTNSQTPLCVGGVAQGCSA